MNEAEETDSGPPWRLRSIVIAGGGTHRAGWRRRTSPSGSRAGTFASRSWNPAPSAPLRGRSDGSRHPGLPSGVGCHRARGHGGHPGNGEARHRIRRLEASRHAILPPLRLVRHALARRCLHHYVASFVRPDTRSILGTIASRPRWHVATSSCSPPIARSTTCYILDWALHFDAHLFARFLRAKAMEWGVCPTSTRRSLRAYGRDVGHICALDTDRAKRSPGFLH